MFCVSILRQADGSSQILTWYASSLDMGSLCLTVDRHAESHTTISCDVCELMAQPLADADRVDHVGTVSCPGNLYGGARSHPDISQIRSMPLLCRVCLVVVAVVIFGGCAGLSSPAVLSRSR